MRKSSLHSFLKITSIAKIIGTCVLVPASLLSNAQSIISPDTVTVGSIVSFNLSGSDKFNSYAWEFETNTFKTLLTTSVAIPNTGTNGNRFDVSANATMVYVDGTKTYHAFVSCASSGFSNPNVQRVDFGANPNNPNPATVDLGNPGNAFITNNTGYHNMQDFKVVKDDAGVFHAFINNGGVVHWVFGNGVDNPPTQATRIFTNPSILGMSINMAVIKYNGSWYIFTGQAFGNEPGLVRLDLGPDLNAIPANIPFQAFPTVSGLSNASYLAVLKEAGNWYITMCSGGGGPVLMRYSFGANLINNNPVITDLGPSNSAATNRGLNYIKTCDSTTLVGLYQDGTVYKYNYANNSIVNVPVSDNLGQKFNGTVAMQSFSPYWYKDTLWALTSNFTNNTSNTVYRFPLASFNSSNTFINYYNSAANHTFNTAGIFDVEVYCDQGENRGPQSFCKQIVVLNPTAVKDVSISGNSLSIYPNPTTNELNLRIPKSGNFSYNICNAIGRVILSVSGKQMVADQIIHLDLNKYAINTGIYCLNLIAENGERYTAKFIKR